MLYLLDSDFFYISSFFVCFVSSLFFKQRLDNFHVHIVVNITQDKYHKVYDKFFNGSHFEITRNALSINISSDSRISVIPTYFELLNNVFC